MNIVRGFFNGIWHGFRRFLRWTGFGEKTLMGYIELIVLPLVLLVGGTSVSEALNASARAQAIENAQEQRLQDYLDQISRLTLDRQLLGGELDPTRDVLVREVARAQTLTALDGMDGPRKRFVITFLYELGLINGTNARIRLHNAELNGADLRGAELFAANLNGVQLAEANLSRARLTAAEANQANLSRANLTGILLVDSRLNSADFRLATMSEADLSNASMFNADLRGADLQRSNFSGANLRSVDLRGANLSGANLTGTNLTDAIIGTDPSDTSTFTWLDGVTWNGTICPSRIVSDANRGSCSGQLNPRPTNAR
ncbi:MAG: pentapeptide repeat-containing protein [Chloroflexi bacterium]|nr:pentapeptide repeat-containing protein [Chloroflexota bacterium]MDA1241036.1 pentapeptide repeat-containing protein [Chloroflexota bacterium]